MTGWRRLPIPLPPAHHETIASWLHRLAAVHGLSSADLRQHLRTGPQLTDAEQVHDLTHRLATLTGQPSERLAWALPELRMPAPDWRRLRRLTQRPCPRCTARYEGGPVRRLFAHDDYLCTRHGYWIGPPDPVRDDSPPQLAVLLPELTAAQHRLRRITRRRGWAATFDATVAATRICLDLRFSSREHPLWMRWERRLKLLMSAPYRRSLFMAAIFPEVATLATLIAAPTWRAMAAERRPVDLERLLDTAAHALGCSEVGHGLANAVMIWVSAHAHGRRPVEPATTYPQTSHHHDGSPRLTDIQRLAEQQTIRRFALDPRAPRSQGPAAAMPYAHRPGPAPDRARRPS